MIQHLSTEENKYNGGFSFEKTLVKREVIKVEDVYYIRVTEYRCASEANGRPVYSYTESYHLCFITDEKIRHKLITADSGLKFAAKTAAYRYEERGTGVLFKLKYILFLARELLPPMKITRVGEPNYSGWQADWSCCSCFGK